MPRLILTIDIHNRPPALWDPWEVADEAIAGDLPTFSPGLDFDVMPGGQADARLTGSFVSAAWEVEEPPAVAARVRAALARLVDALTAEGVEATADDSALFEEVDAALADAQNVLETT